MRRVWLSVPFVVLVAVTGAGCGSGDSEPSQTAASTQGATETQAATEELEGSAPAGAEARGCRGGGADVSDLRVTGIDCATGQAVAAVWSGNASCASPSGGSRFACSVRGYRCLGAATERGIAVGCARPGRSIAFVARRR